MKRLLIGLVVCVWLLSGNVHAIAETTDPATVVAKVNDKEIVQSDVDFIINTIVLPQLQAQYQMEEIPEEQKTLIEQNIVNQLIIQNLLLQVAAESNITADEELVNQQFETIKQQRPDVAPEQLKQLIQTDFIIQKLLQEEVVSKITVSDEETQESYEARKDQFNEPEQVQASHILIMVKSEAPQEEKDAARKKIEDILAQVKAGEDFAELAKEHSDCPSKERGGDLGFFAQGQMVKPFEEAAFALSEGEISDIVETQYGYHIIKATGRKPQRQIPFDEVKDQLQQSLLKQKTDTEVKNWIDELRANATIEIMTPEPQEPQGEETPEEETPSEEETPAQ
jgi:peptidyl-prolyl cis-trans isomerase C